VSYSLDNFLDKNKDFVVAEHASLLGGAGLELLTELFGAPEPEPASTPQNGKVSLRSEIASSGTSSTNKKRMIIVAQLQTDAFGCLQRLRSV
jgi:myosin heavy subunit